MALSEQNKALIERIRPGHKTQDFIGPYYLNALLDAARAEQKEDAEPVACFVCNGDCSGANPPVAGCPKDLTADFVRALPGGKLDDTEYEKIEDALDRLDAPMSDASGRWLKLHERIAALHPPRAEQPVMSREAVEKLLRENLELTCGRNCEREMGVADENAAYREAADAILALASLGGRGGEDRSSQSQPVLSPKSDTDGPLYDELWCCHARGPDDLIAAPSYEIALALADYANSISPIIRAVPALWPWTPSAHVDDMEKNRASIYAAVERLSGRPLGAEDGQLRDEQNLPPPSPGGEQEATDWKYRPNEHCPWIWSDNPRDGNYAIKAGYEVVKLYASPVRGAGEEA